MRLSQFIDQNMPAILAEWDTFARANAPPSANLSHLALRNHAQQILRAIARDIETAQSAEEQLQKSQGLSDSLEGESVDAAIHGKLRHESDFSLLQLTAEYRALRATVLRLWIPTLGRVDADTTQEIVRFNEAIDQALAVSVVAYEKRASRTRELFLAVLGHDLRSPLSTVDMVGAMMARHELSRDQVVELGNRLQRSTRLMKRMVADLLGFTRIRLGAGLPVSPQQCDLGDVLRNAMADAQASYPDANFDLQVPHEISSCWDTDRLHQLFMNLMVNAVQHGTPATPVTIHARNGGDNVVVDVRNFGQPIPKESLKSIFKPLVQHREGDANSHPSGSLGLGLYIAREITERHGGRIAVASNDDDGTVFSVTLPLRAEC